MSAFKSQLTLSWLPFMKKEEWTGYNPNSLRRDFQSGATVAIFAIPQVMAYAVLAGMAPVQGLYAAIVMSLVAALWGNSPFLNTGPTNSSALLTSSALLGLGVAQGEQALQAIFLLTLMVGLIRMAMGLLQLGWIVRFVSQPAFLGFSVGAGLLIALGQFHHLLGIPAATQASFIARMTDVIQRIPQAQPLPIILGLGTLAIMVLFHRFNRHWPVALLAIGAATIAAIMLDGKVPVRLVRDIAPIHAGLPAFSAFAINSTLILTLLPAALTIALIGLIEAIATGELIALKKRQPFNVNQEFLGQGLSQTVSAFFQGFPGSGSFSRSALIEQTGGQTRLANVFFGVVTALAVLTIPQWLERIPIASLAGLLLYVGWHLIDFKRVRCVVETSKTDTIVMILTVVVTVFIKIEYGLLAGLLLAILFLLREVSLLKLYEFLPCDATRFQEHPYQEGHPHQRSDIVALSVHSRLFFGVAHTFRHELGEILRIQKPRYVVLRLRRANTIDYTCWSVIFEFAQVFHEQGGQLFLVGAPADTRRIIADAGMSDFIPNDRIVNSTPIPYQALRATISRIIAQCGPDICLAPEWERYRVERKTSPLILTDSH